MTLTGFLHPGSMGASLARTCAGPRAWASDGRSAATAARAGECHLEDMGTIEELSEACDIIVSICPPSAALAVAEEVASSGFDGLYVDANAVSPGTVRSVAALFDRFVDGAVIGPPVVAPGVTRLWLSGDEAEGVARLWEGSDLDARVIPGAGPGSASALKMAYAGWTKATSALLMAIRALAEAEGVADALLDEWAISQPELAERSERSAAGGAPKAWRWAGEMREISDSFANAGLPEGFHAAAALVYDRLAAFKDASPPPSLEEVIAELLGPGR